MATIEIPRGPIWHEKGGTYDTPDRHEKLLLNWRDSALQQAIAELRDNPEYESIEDYIDLISGAHWKATAQPNWRAKFTDNRISKARIEVLAYLTDIKPTIDITTKVDQYVDTARIIKEVIQREWKDRRMDLALEGVLDHALFGTGFWKISCSYPGEFKVVPCGMDTVLPIQQGDDIQESTSVLYRVFRPPHFFKSRWPNRSIDIEKEVDSGMMGIQSNQYTKPWGINEYTWNSMSPSMRYHKSRTNPQSSIQDHWADFPLIQLQEFWIEDWHVNETSSTVIVKDPYKNLDEHNYWYRVNPGERLYPRKRLLVFAGDRVMYDGPSPYWHGLFPFAKLRLNPVVWGTGGLSFYRDLKPLNLSLNRLGSGLENVVDKAIKPIVVTKDGAMPATSWERFFSDRPGSRLKLTALGNPATDVRFIDPPNLPGYVLNYQTYLLQTIRELSGALDTSALGKKKQLPGGDTIEQFKDAMSAPRRRELRNLEVFLEDAGRIAVPCVAQFFSRDQRMRMLGDRGLTSQDFDFRPGMMDSWAGLPEEFHKNFAIEIVSGSMHAGSRDRNKQMALVLQRQGAISLRELFRQLEVQNVDQIFKEIMEEHQMGIGVAPPKGRSNMTRGQKNGQPI